MESLSGQYGGVEGTFGRRCGQRRRVAVAVAAMTALAGGACGSGGSDQVVAGGAGPTTAIEQDRVTAMRYLLSPADVPNLPPGAPSLYDRFYARCGVDPLMPGGDDPRQAPPVGFVKDDSAEVKRAQTTTVGSYSVVAPNEEAAKVVIATLRSPEFRTCFERELRNAVNTAVGRQVVVGTASADLAKPVLGDEALAFRTTLSGPSGAYQTFDLTTVRRGRALVSVTTGRLGTSVFPDDERIRLVRLVAGRMG